MWSEKKYINIIINILLFLISINFMHYGQLFLPTVCLILFFDNKCQIKITNKKIFALLIMFGMCFFVFSYKLGFYSVMGFCFPMGYYIGCNLKNRDFDSIKNLIYIISFGMAIHMLLNFGLELFWSKGNIPYIFNKISHYDFWLYIPHINDVNPNAYQLAKIRSTCTAMYYLLILSSIYYLIFYEENKKNKYIGIAMFALSSIYALALGRRTSIIMFVLAFTLSITIDIIYIKKSMKLLLKPIIAVSIIVTLFIVAYSFNIFNIKMLINNSRLVQKIMTFGFNGDRITIFYESIKYYWQYLWGGQNISTIIGLQPHNLWGDIYDYAGIIPYVLMILFFIYSIYYLIQSISKYKKTELVLLIPLLVVTTLQLFLEPVMTGNSIYLICYIIIVSSINSINE